MNLSYYLIRTQNTQHPVSASHALLQEEQGALKEEHHPHSCLSSPSDELTSRPASAPTHSHSNST